MGYVPWSQLVRTSLVVDRYQLQSDALVIGTCIQGVQSCDTSTASRKSLGEKFNYNLLAGYLSATFATETVSTTTYIRTLDRCEPSLSMQPPRSTNTDVVPRIYDLRPDNE
jgi:hypothetical protein